MPSIRPHISPLTAFYILSARPTFESMRRSLKVYHHLY